MSKEICRLCLAHPSVYFSLLEDNLSEMLESLTSIKVDKNGAQSTISCLKCLLNMKLAFSIQQKILTANEKLKELVLYNVEFKTEVSEIDINYETIIGNDLTDSEPQHCNCVICGLNMENKFLTKHVQEHFTDKQTCDFCNKSFSNIDEYKGHICNHKQINYECPQCGASFRYKSLYNIHLNKAHKSESKLSVNDEMPVESKEEKAIPVKTKVKKKTPVTTKVEKLGSSFICDLCPKIFSSKKQLRNHTHKKEKCPICEAEVTKTNLRKHITNHSSGPQICELCGATLRSLESLRGHIKLTHSKLSFCCDECGKLFRKRYLYMLHKKKHAGEKTHVCESCGKAFLTNYYLRKHIKTAHLKLRPFVCKYCTKAFSSKFALTTHVRQHTNETPYKCEVCGNGFRQNVSLRSHRRSKHNIVEPKTCACTVCGKLFGSDHAVISHMRLH